MKKSLSLLLVLAMLVSLFAGLGAQAFAAEEDVVFSVYTQQGAADPVLAKSYSADELAALKETSEGNVYVYYKNGTSAYVVTEYVALSALLTDAGVTYAAGDYLAFSDTEGPYTKGDFSYETMAKRGVDPDGNAVPTAIALTYAKGNLDEADVKSLAAEAKAGALQFVSGMTAEEAEAKTAAGNRLPSRIVSITVVTPEKPVLEIYTQAGKGAAEKLVKSYTASELDALKETAEGYVYVYYKNGTSAYVVTEYVTLSALLTDAGVTYAAGDYLAFSDTEGPYTKGDFSYETMAKRGVDPDGNAVPTAVALTYAKGNLDEADVKSLAAEAKAGALQFVSGMTAEEAENKTAAGNRLPSRLAAITVVGQPVVQATTQGLKVDGADKTTEIYNISGYNYFKLRDIAALLTGTDAQFDVSFDAETKTVSVTTGQAYTPIEGDLTTGTDKSASCVLSSWKVEVNGEAKDIVAYNLGGNNFFKLKDLGTALGFGVAYDEATRTMLVTSK